MIGFVQLTLYKIKDERLTSKQVLVRADTIVTMEPDVLAYKDTITPATLIQAVQGNCSMSLYVQEKPAEIVKMLAEVTPRGQ